MYYDYNYGYTTAATITGWAIILYLFIIAIGIFTIICQWKVFKKAGKNGWEAIIPIYNTIVALEIAELPIWYVVLTFVPIANIFVVFKLNIELAHKFNKSTGFGILLAFFSFIGYAILAFDKNITYVGNNSINNIQNDASFNNIAEPNEGEVKYCANCGTKNEKNTEFCSKCGTKF